MARFYVRVLATKHGQDDRSKGVNFFCQLSILCMMGLERYDSNAPREQAMRCRDLGSSPYHQNGESDF
jgi:hypothetical protein